MPENAVNQDRIVFTWYAREFIPQDKSPFWYIAAAIVAAAVIIYGFITQSWTMVAVFVLLVGVYYLLRDQEPHIIPVTISELGVYVGRDFYQYRDIVNFWIVYNPGEITTLNFYVREGRFAKRVSVQLEDQDPVYLREYLRRKVTEVSGVGEDGVERFLRKIKL